MQSIREEEEKKQMSQIYLERATCYFNIIKENNKSYSFLTEEERAKPIEKRNSILKKLNNQITHILVEDLKRVVEFHEPFRSKCDKLYEDLKKIVLNKEEDSDSTPNNKSNSVNKSSKEKHKSHNKKN